MNHKVFFLLLSSILLFSKQNAANVYTPCIHNSINLHNDNILSFYEERDLEIFSSLNNSHSGLYGIINTTATNYGATELKNLLAQLITDITTIKERQSLLHELVANEELFNSLEQELATFKKHEKALQFFWDSRNNEFVEKTLSKFYYSYNFLKTLNDSPLALDIGHILEFGALFGTTIEHCLMEFGIDQVIFGITGGCGHDHHHHHHDHDCSMTPFQKFIKKTWQTAHWSFHALSFIEMANHLKHKSELVDVLHQEMLAVSSCIKAMYKIQRSITKLSQNKATQAFYNSTNLDRLTELFASHDEKFNHPIVESLLSDNFENNEDNSLSFYSGVGTTLVACAQFNQEKNSFIPSLQAIGKIDAFMAIARWIKKNQNTKTPICFAQEIQSTTPYISLKNAWNPMLQNNAISTDIEFGDSSEIKTSKMLLTGPNKSGKTSLLKTIAFNVILAQTFGIGTASSMHYTPFHKIITYLTVSDDITTGHSSMTSELLRTDNCIKTLASMAPHTFALVLIDDALFKRTSFTIGQDAAYGFIKALEQFNQAIELVITHFPRLSQLEKETNAKFRNYQTNIVFVNGKKTSTYSLKRGICEQRAIFDLIDADGTVPNFINN